MTISLATVSTVCLGGGRQQFVLITMYYKQMLPTADTPQATVKVKEGFATKTKILLRTFTLFSKEEYNFPFEFLR